MNGEFARESASIATMTRSVLLLMIVVIASVCTVSVAQPVASFTQQPIPPWAPRIIQGWAWTTTTISYTLLNGTSGMAPVNSLVTWGGGDIMSYNDIYLSLDKGNTFNLIGGVGVSGINSSNLTYINSAHNVNNFAQDDTGACKAYDPYQGYFYIFDETYAWKSTDAIDWYTTNTSTSAEYVWRQSTECLVTQSSAIVILGGQSSGSAYENDVWTTTNGGSSFTQETNAAPWTQRDSSRGFAMMTSSGTEVIYMMGGHAKVVNIRSSEIWLSSDSGVHWALLTSAPWLSRDHFTAVLDQQQHHRRPRWQVRLDSTGGNHIGMNDAWL